MPSNQDDFDIELNDDQRFELLNYRGGCSCQHPPFCPPCSACTEPITMQEAIDLGFTIKIDDLSQIVSATPNISVSDVPGLRRWLDGEWAVDTPPDYSAITKSFCK